MSYIRKRTNYLNTRDMQVWQLITIGVMVHLILFYSIFDIYFTSPLVHGMERFAPESPPPAKRLVLFSADGLRADKLFGLGTGGKTHAPYLRNILTTNGSWGVSHTRVPTESRPGHVAMIAGFYEDVSAVAKGWKENPVEFDSVFNESRATWSWGSPDILPMFAKGASGDHVFTDSYTSAEEDFASANAARLDIWVFDKVTEFLAAARGNATLYEKLHQDKIVFFLHLLGLDTNGHSHKPYSSIYMRSIEIVDEGIKNMVSLFEEFYQHDEKTAYVMSADHGMTDWGSHGSGDPQETLTPLVAWGAGIRKAAPHDSCGDHADNFCSEWQLSHVKRNDVSQADVAPLMSYLIGTAFPKNSLGVLPLSYLGVSDWHKAEGLFANAQQIAAQYQVKMTQIKDTTFSLTFRPFKDLSPSDEVGFVRHIRKLIQTGNYKQAITESQNFIEKSLRGLNYYQTYDRLFLGLSIVCGFLCWMCYVVHLVLREHSGLVLKSQKYSSSLQQHLQVNGVAGVIVCLMLLVQSSPLTYYVYSLMSVFMVTAVYNCLHIYIICLKAASEKRMIFQITGYLVLCFLGLELAVLSFFYRQILSVGLICVAFWSFVSKDSQKSKFISFGWLFSCLLLAVFPLLPVVGRNANYNLVLVSGIAAVFFGCAVAIWFGLLQAKPGVSQLVICLQLVSILLATYIVWSTSHAVQHYRPVPAVNHTLSWIILVVSPVLPLLMKTSVKERLFSLALAFMSPFLLMSITYEGLFVLSLLTLLFFWIRMEEMMSSTFSKKELVNINFVPSGPHLSGKKILGDATPMRWLELDDLRRAFFYVFLILTAFFGMGNIASINSFDPASVYCFVTVFSPFMMGTLMILRNLIPFLLVTCALRAIHVVTDIPIRALFLLVMVMTDFMGLHFFFLVKDYGSWLDIGTSISHYVIAMVMNITLMLIMGLSHVLTCSRLTLSWNKDQQG
ncbi:GPI ethanolamine phosphate transferase 1-like [Gigantopelta aegis]|uniref:GPI ethanolamine phosphate transferase 1-like n=1 Tax=Gigantopelta aegis TaxID=1735272 RepID=UPI001B888B43|nr:GPI ethanolamine phosphate transferase 1-like [Gigantopelta aegis]